MASRLGDADGGMATLSEHVGLGGPVKFWNPGTSPAGMP